MAEQRGVQRESTGSGRVVPSQRRPVLVALRALGLGDFATGVPALRALERAFPRYRRVLAGPESYRDLLVLAGLDWETLVVEGPDSLPWGKRRPPEIAVNLHGRGPLSVGALAGLDPGRLWSYRHHTYAGPGRPRWPGGLHDVNVWCGLLERFGIPTRPGDLRWPAPDTSAVPSGTAVVHPGASSGSRRWPELRFAEVARGLRGRGLRVVVTGSANERRLAERVARVAGLEPRSVLAGGTTPHRLAELVAGARLLVCGDTGVAHLATAYGTPSVLLFGPSSPAVWGPLIDIERHLCLWAGTTGDPHADRLDPGLASITVRDTLAACDDLLEGRPSVPVRAPGELIRW
ncbi:glycosyltransferase family 9 protein [Actinorugispora endophytica]|uniref:ADP-heptose:LPS heptosyltransferase n=1 Tax=Actinorugispora endophytica TaxID=1605990 RepID=A0A4R6UWE2_9ACTN|nr:glycosyltransferase family 9 protein [Actinorugispora endophytica]TDQ51571.1 ADP-heptose:LPS heptosyltransferase [Actinorugispora endophytica]